MNTKYIFLRNINLNINSDIWNFVCYFHYWSHSKSDFLEENIELNTPKVEILKSEEQIAYFIDCIYE